MRKYTRSFTSALLALLLVLSPWYIFAQTQVVVSNYTELVSAINTFNTNTYNVEIVLTGTVKLTGELPIIQGLGGNTLTITGTTGAMIDGDGKYRGLIIDTAKENTSQTSSVVLDSVTFKQCVATGGAGGSGLVGGGGGMGAGGAIYAKSGYISLQDVQFETNSAIGGQGGNVLSSSNTSGGGGGLSHSGQSGTVGDSLLSDGIGGNGGDMLLSIGSGKPANTTEAGAGGGIPFTPYVDGKGHTWNQQAHNENGITGKVGGDGGYGGGAGGSRYVGGDGGVGGGGGAGREKGGAGGFGGGGGGSLSANTAGLGGFGAGNGGYQANLSATITGGGVGGGGAALGGAVYIETDAIVSVVYTKNTVISGNTVTGGAAGVISGTSSNGSATAGEGIGSGFFLKDDVSINVAKDITVTVNDGLGGYAGAIQNKSDLQEGGIIKMGKGTLLLTGVSSYTGNTVIEEGTLQVGTKSLSQYSSLVSNGGLVTLFDHQSIENLYTDIGSAGGQLDLNGKLLKITEGGTNGESFKGIIVSNGNVGEGGMIEKYGAGELRLAGDSRGASIRSIIAPEKETFTNSFITAIFEGTVVAENNGAFGDGMIAYRRTDTSDISLAIAFTSNVTELANQIAFYDNTVNLRIGADSTNLDPNSQLTLSGRIVANSGTESTLHVLMNNAAQTLRITNTGVDSETGYSSAKANNFGKIYLEKGTVELVADKFTDSSTGNEYWNDSLGNASLVNAANGNTLRYSGDPLEDNLVFGTNLNVAQGLLTVSNTWGGQDVTLVNNEIWGAGGINVDMVNATDIFRIAGVVAYTGTTKITNGILDVSEANNTATGINLGLLATDANTTSAVVAVGDRLLVINSSESGQYVGAITDFVDDPSDDGISIKKTGTGTWSLGLKNQAGIVSNVSDITVEQGKLGFVDDSLTGMKIKLTSTGGLAITRDQTLTNLDAKTVGTLIAIDLAKTLTLAGDTETTIGSSLHGGGTLRLENVFVASESGDVLAPWILAGVASDWNGTIELDALGELTLAAVGAVTNTSGITLGNGSSLYVGANNSLGLLTLGLNNEIETAAGKTLALINLRHQEGTVGDLLITGAGTVSVSADGAADFVGNTTIRNAMLKVVGNITSDVPSRGITRLENGTLALDYSGEPIPKDADDMPLPFTSLWGNEAIQIANNGISTVNVTGTTGQVTLINELAFDNTPSGSDAVVPTLEFDTNITKLSWTGEMSGKGNIYKNGTGTFTLDGSLADGAELEMVNVGKGILILGENANANNLLDHTAVTVSTNGTLSGWADNMESLSLYGRLLLSQTGNVSLGAAAQTNAFSMYSGSLVNIDVKSDTDYTSFSTENGNIALHGGTIHVEVAPTYSSEAALGTGFLILETENGALTANTSALRFTDNVIGQRLVARYTNKTLELAFTGVDFTEYSLSASSLAVGRYLNIVSDLNQAALVDMINEAENSLDFNPHLLEELTGEMYLSAMGAQIRTQNQIRNAVSQLALAGRNVSSGRSKFRGQSSHSNFNAWGTFLGAGGNFGGVTEYSNFDYSLYAGIFGAEMGSGASPRLGLFYSYANSKTDAGNNMGRVKMSENLFGTYLKWEDPIGYGLVMGTFGLANYDASRSLLLASGQHSIESKQNGWSGSVYGEKGFDWKTGGFTLSPFLGLQYTHLKQNGFDEDGYSPFRLSFSDVNYDSFFTLLGARVSKSWGALELRLYAQWLHEFLDTAVEGEAVFVSVGTGAAPFFVQSTNFGKDWALAGIGGEYQMGNNLSIFGSGDGQIGSGSTIISGNMGLRYQW